jgi:ferrous iron transport protein A
MTTQLSSLKIGDWAKIIALKSGSFYYRHKLLSLGMIPGAKFRVVRMAPLGCPIEIISERGIKITVRKKEVEILAVEKA